MGEAANPTSRSYASFNDFFTRAAASPGARPLAERRLRLPGRRRDQPVRRDRRRDQIFQAKGHRYTTTALVGGDAALAAQFRARQLRHLYLSPKDYHRIHMPCDGRLTRMIYVPGDAVLGEPGHGARRAGPVRAQRARGLRVRVGRARPVRAGAGRRDHRRQHGDRVARRGQSAARAASCANGATTTRQIVLKKGEEMGRFLLGSTVVMLFRKDSIVFNPDGRRSGRCGSAR